MISKSDIADVKLRADSVKAYAFKIELHSQNQTGC
jgi:hypothetical protein